MPALRARLLRGGGTFAGSWNKSRRVVENHGSTAIDLAKRLHRDIHVQVAVVDECLFEMRQGTADIAKVDDINLARPAEVIDGREHIPKIIAPLSPTTSTK